MFNLTKNIQLFGCISEKCSEIYFFVFGNILVNAIENILFTNILHFFF